MLRLKVKTNKPVFSLNSGEDAESLALSPELKDFVKGSTTKEVRQTQLTRCFIQQTRRKAAEKVPSHSRAKPNVPRDFKMKSLVNDENPPTPCIWLDFLSVLFLSDIFFF